MHPILQAWLSGGRGRKILLLRHGEIFGPTDPKRFLGQTDLPLSEHGRRQAQWWRQCLFEVPLAGIVSSDLDRCRKTAQIIAADRSVAVETHPGLREIHLGRWEGMSFNRVKADWPHAFRERGDDIAAFRPPQGESFKDLRQRVVPVFEEAIDQAGSPLLVVAHAGVNRMILCHILGLATENLLRLAQGYGAMNLIDRSGGAYRLHALNWLPDSNRS